MLWRHLCLVRAWSAAGLLSASLLGTAFSAPAPMGDDPSPRPDTLTETVSILDAKKAGDLTLEVRGAGEDHVRMTLKNSSAKRLNVVLPPGLVASSTVGQGRPGGGFQSMGLGSASNRMGTFGEFRTASNRGESGFRSVKVSEGEGAKGVAVPVGQSVELTLTSVCLNFGIKTPTPRDKFELVDVDDYTNDPRVRKALRSLATYGTSQGVAQAVMWNVCNAVPFEMMAQRSPKTMNLRELALASRFVDALDLSSATDLVDPTYLTEGRLFVRVLGDGSVQKDAERLARQLDGLRVLGLPVRLFDAREAGARSQPVVAPAVLVSVVLSPGQASETKGKILLSQADASGQWVPMGKTSFVEGSAAAVLDGAGLARALDHAIASAFVTVKHAGRTPQATVLKVENRLPFTLVNVAIKAGDSSGAPIVPFAGVGIAPGRVSTVSIQAPAGKVDHVELNGL